MDALLVLGQVVEEQLCKMENNLLIIFAKNPILGKVKTRLAEALGAEKTLEIYLQLLDITELATLGLQNSDVHVYFSEKKELNYWKNHPQFIQKGADLGEKMLHAFENGFALGYQKIIGMGSDLPEIKAEIIQSAFELLTHKDTVFGPAKDGGYYLLGMKKLHKTIFLNQAWSTETLLEDTIEQLVKNKISFSKLDVLNDIDTIEDYIEYRAISMRIK